MSDIDESMYRLTVQQRDQAWREIQYWQRKCDAMRAQLDATISAMSGLSALQINPPVKLLANAESYEAGRVMERERIAKLFDGPVWAYDYREIAAKIREGGDL